MSQCESVFGASASDRLTRLTQKRVFRDRVEIPSKIAGVTVAPIASAPESRR